MTNTRNIKRLQRLESFTANGVSPAAINVSDFKHISVSLAGDNSAAMTIKFQASLGSDAPDFSAAKALDNEWDYVQVVDYQDGASIAGDVGIAFAGDDVRQFVCDVEGVDFISFEITGYSAGDVTPKLSAYTNA